MPVWGALHRVYHASLGCIAYRVHHASLECVTYIGSSELSFSGASVLGGDSEGDGNGGGGGVMLGISLISSINWL